MEWFAMQFPSRRARVGVLVAAIPLFAVSAFAQTGQSTISSLAAAQAQAAAAAPPSTETVQRLSIDEAVRLAVEQNLGIRIQRIDPQVQDVGVWQARSFWAPQLSSTIAKNSVQTPVTSILSGTAASVNQGQFTSGITLAEQLPWGASYSANWNNSRLTTTDPTTTFNPRLSSNLSLNLSQPLVRNRSIDQIRQQVSLSKQVRNLSDIQLQSVITQTLRSVKNAYWDLVYAIGNLKAQQQSLDLSEQSLRDNRRRVEIGTMAPIDIVQAQAEVASNEQGVIIAAAAIKTAQDNLRTLILDPSAPNFWNITFEPTDAPEYREEQVDTEGAVKTALAKRADLLAAKNSLSQSDVNIRYFRNQILPDVNAQVSYGAVGIGGVQLQPAVDFLTGTTSGPATVLADRSYGSALNDVFRSAFPQWSFGVQIAYPLGASTSQANLARAKLQYEQAQAQYKNLEMLVATQVRAIARNVETNQKRVQSARAARELQEKKLEAEEKKQAAGMSSPFFVIQAQRDLALARTAELQAVSDYNKSIVDLEAVQQVPVGGSVGSVTPAGAGTIQTGSSAIIRSGGN
jgi:outer membrane protein